MVKDITVKLRDALTGEEVTAIQTPSGKLIVVEGLSDDQVTAARKAVNRVYCNAYSPLGVYVPKSIK